MMDIEQINARLEIEKLNADFLYFIDNNQIAPLVDLFTVDAHYAHAQRVTSGRDELTELFGLRLAGKPRTSRHLQSGLRINFQSITEADGQSVCLTYADNGTPPFQNVTPTLIADFNDSYQFCDDGKWRIQSRQIDRIFEAPGGKPYGQIDS